MNSNIEVTATFRYLENYDEEWEKISEIYQKYGGDSDAFIEQREKLRDAISEKSPEKAKKCMENKITSTFFETDFEISEMQVEQSENEFRITAVVTLIDIQNGFRPSDYLKNDLQKKFDGYIL